MTVAGAASCAGEASTPASASKPASAIDESTGETVGTCASSGVFLVAASLPSDTVSCKPASRREALTGAELEAVIVVVGGSGLSEAKYSHDPTKSGPMPHASMAINLRRS